MEGSGDQEDQWTIERDGFKGSSPLVILVLTGVSVFCIYILLAMVRDGDANPVALVMFSAYPVLVLPYVAWEVRHWLPARLEMSSHSARYLVNGRLKMEIILGPDVKADAKLSSDRIGPEPRAFDNSCAKDRPRPSEESFLLLCGISLSQGDSSITVSHDDGWSLVDLGKISDRFLDMALDHEMELGHELWRYMEFRNSFQRQGANVEPDIFDRIRAMET